MRLIEFHEQPWIPRFLREGATDYLRTATEVAGHYEAILPILTEMLGRMEEPRVVDLGSGAGGGWPYLQPKLEKALGRPVSVHLTDFHPNRPALAALEKSSQGKIQFEPSSVDARRVPPEWTGLRTLVNVFHHFNPEDARAILADAHRQQRPILVVEALDKNWLQGLLILLLTPLLVWLLTPRIRPFRLRSLVFTYLVPILPLLITWDGLVSVLRLYSPSQMKHLVANMTGMDWKYGRLRQGSITLLYLKGQPHQPLA